MGACTILTTRGGDRERVPLVTSIGDANEFASTGGLIEEECTVCVWIEFHFRNAAVQY